MTRRKKLVWRLNYYFKLPYMGNFLLLRKKRFAFLSRAIVMIISIINSTSTTLYLYNWRWQKCLLKHLLQGEKCCRFLKILHLLCCNHSLTPLYDWCFLSYTIYMLEIILFSFHCSVIRQQISNPCSILKVKPCIRLARGKSELTNQDSVGGKNFSVLM